MPVNAAGLDFYDRLVDELLGNGIAPYVTLFHWDTPQALEDAGGWPARDTVDAFAEYVEAVAGRLGDRVGHWITHNEPWVVSWVGHGWGHHAPGRTSDADALATAHHLLLSHGRAVEILRAASPGSEVGITLNLDNPYPASPSEEDAQAVRWVDGLHNRWFLDPLFRGSYPADMLEAWEPILPEIADGDLETIVDADRLPRRQQLHLAARRRRRARRPLADRAPQRRRPHRHGLGGRPRGAARPARPAPPRLRPAGDLRDRERRRVPRRTRPRRLGQDPERQSYLQGHIDAAARAIAEGVPLRGYFAWSLLDNFEWAWGYWKRFGLVYIDYATLERVPKGSFYWYRDFIAAQRVRATGSEEAATRAVTRGARRPGRMR